MKREARFDDKLARMGGDEFAILMKANVESLPDIFSERLKHEFDAYATSMSQLPRVNASIGCVSFTGDGSVSVKQLIQRADDAMTHSKLIEGTALTMWEPGMTRQKWDSSRR